MICGKSEQQEVVARPEGLCLLGPADLLLIWLLHELFPLLGMTGMRERDIHSINSVTPENPQALVSHFFVSLEPQPMWWYDLHSR